MSGSFFSITLVVMLLSMTPHFSKADDTQKSGWLREKIKERIKKKLEEKPAPVASTEVTKKIEKAGDYTYVITWGEGLRYYKVHVPQKYSASKKTPLLFAFHGGAGDMEIQSTEEYYHQISKSESEGDIVVFPNGFSQFQSAKIATWNAGKCCGLARDKGIDDIGFVKEILKNLSLQLNIDRDRIFATGMSNGAMMSYRLACEMSDVFKAIAPVAGTDNTTACNPSKPISILHIHAKDDDHVLFNGGAGKPLGGMASVTDFVSVPNTISKWVKLNHCDPTPKRVLEKAGVYCDQYSKCNGGVHVKLCVTDTGGHSWPGGTKPRFFPSKEEPSNAISANDIMWEFFNQKL
jgi:polyhydroxybutyrate depolymerase